MSVPLDLSLISQLLNEQKTEGDLNALTKPGFFFVSDPTNTPNDSTHWCHVINLFNYNHNEHTAAHMRIFQIYINDNKDDNTVWYRQYSFNAWTSWERFVTATDLADYATKNLLATTLENYYAKGVIDEKLNSKVNNSDLVADYYNKTDVDSLINTINSALNNKAIYGKTPMENVAAKIYDNNGTVHSETTDNAYNFLVGSISVDLLVKTRAIFNLQDDYPVNTKFTKIAISTEAFRPYYQAQPIPAMITISFDSVTSIVATLDTDNSDTEYFIYNVPTNLQTKPIGKGTVFEVFF